MPQYRKISRYVLAGLFTFAGIVHFLSPEMFVRIVPPYLPAPLLLVYVSGMAEIAGGLGLLVPTTRRMASWGLILLLVAVFPANVYMFQSYEGSRLLPVWALWLRLPLQVVLVAWAWWIRKE